MEKIFVIIAVGTLTGLTAFGAIDLKESKFTQVVNDVQIISTADNSKHTASVDGLFKMPDVLRTGPASRAELVAADNTITRVGANTIFSFDAANRSIHLEQGSLLFNSPKGKGGGSIHTAAATAAVLGTTIIVVTTPSGGFKVLTLEGTAEVNFLNGLKRKVPAGQLIFVLPGGLPGPVLSFRLDQQVANSRLVQGFTKPLASISKVEAQITKQTKQIASGKASDTGMLVGSDASTGGVQTINVIAEINGSPNAEMGFGGGGSSSNVPPPTIVAPPGLTFNGSGFVQPDGFVFTSPVGTPITDAEIPALATIGAANDVNIASSSLDSSHIFITPVQVQVPELGFEPTHTVTGFIARNITFNTQTLDLSPYSSLPRFVFLATEGLTISGSLNTGPADSFSGEVDFAGATLTIAPGTTITSQSSEMDFATIAALNLNQVTIANSGEVQLSSSDSSISLTDSTVSGSFVEMDAAGSLTLAGTSPATGAITAPTGIELNSESGMTVGVNLTASQGSISLENDIGALILTPGVQVSAGGDISLTSFGSINITSAMLQGANVELQSYNGLTLNGAIIGANPGNGEVAIRNYSSAPLTINNGTTLTGGSSIYVQSYGALSFDSSSVGGLDPAPNVNLNGSGAVTLNQTPVSGNEINISSGSTLTLSQGVNAPGTITGVSSIFLESGNGLMDSVNLIADPMQSSIALENEFGQLHVASRVQITGGSVEFISNDGDVLIDPGVTVNSFGNVAFEADGNITVGAQVTSVNGNIGLDSSEGDLDLSPGASLNGASVNLTSESGSIVTDGTSTITASGTSAILHSANSMSIGGNIIAPASGGSVSLLTDSGPMTINAGVQISADVVSAVSGSTLQTDSSAVFQGNTAVQLNSASGATIGGTFTANQQTGAISIANGTGLLNVNNSGSSSAKFVASVITFNSPDGILINTPGQVIANQLNVISSTISPTATAQIQNADLSNVGSLNVNARTVVLSDVALPNSGNSVFTVGNGLVASGANTHQQIILGDLNLYEGVTYHNTLISDSMIQQGAGGFSVKGP